MTGSSAYLANVRSGIRGGKVTAKVELRPEKNQGEAQSQQADYQASPAHIAVSRYR